MADPRIWGGDLWASLHRMTLLYPTRPTKAQRRAAMRFFESLISLLPCTSCRAHYSEYFSKTFSYKTTASKATLARWLFELHCAVNTRLGKKNTVAFEDLPRIYLHFPDRFVSKKGDDLLDVARYEPLLDNFAGAETPIKRSRAVLDAVAIPSDLLAEKGYTKEELEADLREIGDETAGLDFYIIIIIAFAVLTAVVIAVAIAVVWYKNKRKNTNDFIAAESVR